MNMKKLFALLLAVMMVFALAACGGGGDTAKDETGDKAGDKADEMVTYKVAMEPTFPPFDTTDPDTQKLTGFDVDMMEAIAADQGFKLEWMSMEFNALIPSLESGNIDIIASALNASEERREKVDFSTTYYDSALVVAIKAGNTAIKSIDDLTPDMKVGGQIATTGGDMAQELADAGKIKEAKIYNGVDTAVMDLQNGTIDALINDLPVTKKYMSMKPGTIEIVGDKLNAEAYGYAVKKGNSELLEKINKGMENLKANGTFDKIYKEWLE